MPQTTIPNRGLHILLAFGFLKYGPHEFRSIKNRIQAPVPKLIYNPADRDARAQSAARLSPDTINQDIRLEISEHWTSVFEPKNKLPRGFMTIQFRLTHRRSNWAGPQCVKIERLERTLTGDTSSPVHACDENRCRLQQNSSG